MKHAIALIIGTFLLLSAACIPAAHADSSQPSSRTLPIIVKVDAKGSVTDITPAYRLSPGFEKLVRETLAKMITSPAYKDGDPVPSQFVITLGVIKNEAAQGKSNVTLKYLGSKALPDGNWYWIHIPPDNRLALGDQKSQFFKNRTLDTNQLVNAMRNQRALDAQTLGGPSSLATPSVGTAH